MSYQAEVKESKAKRLLIDTIGTNFVPISDFIPTPVVMTGGLVVLCHYMDTQRMDSWQVRRLAAAIVRRRGRWKVDDAHDLVSRFELAASGCVVSHDATFFLPTDAI